MTFDELLDLGVYEFAGFDENDSEPLYCMNMDAAKEHAVELYWQEINSIQQGILDAVEEGYLEWDFDPETLEESLIVTKRGEEVV